jgi:hypothetical protein
MSHHKRRIAAVCAAGSLALTAALAVPASAAILTYTQSATSAAAGTNTRP